MPRDGGPREVRIAHERRVVDHRRLLGHRRHLAPHVRGHPPRPPRRHGRRRRATRRRPRRRCGSSRAGRPPRWPTRATSCWRTARSLPNLHALPPDLPLGYHDLQPQSRRPGRRGSSSRPAGAGCPTGRGAGRSSSTPCGRRAAGASATSATCAAWPTWSRRPGRRRGDDQPAARRRARRAPAAEPVLAHVAGCGATWPTCGSRDVPGRRVASTWPPSTPPAGP